MIAPAGWFPDPSGRRQVRWFDGWRWSEWVSVGGQPFAMPLTPPATGGGTLVTEPVLVMSASDPVTLGIRTPAGLPLATATDPDGTARRADVADPTGHVVLRMRRSGMLAMATVVVRSASAEVGRYEPAGSSIRILARGALVALVTVPTPEAGAVWITDPSGGAIGRLQRRAGTWTTEVARPLGDPLHALVALTSVAIELVETSDEVDSSLFRRGSRPSS